MKTGLAFASVMVLALVSCTPDNQINGHQYVDLGLPSGLLWAETNIGAESDADAGAYFAWGETAAKDDYSWASYSYGAAEDSLSGNYSLKGNTVLLPADDAARANWGGSWRMPTHAEFAELRDSANCSWTWEERTAANGKKASGYLVTSKRNGNSIVLPASGYRDGKDTGDTGGKGFYWTSSLSTLYGYYAFFHCVDKDCPYGGYDYRYLGLSVRPVAAKQ